MMRAPGYRAFPGTHAQPCCTLSDGFPCREKIHLRELRSRSQSTFNRVLTLLKSACNEVRLAYSHWVEPTAKNWRTRAKDAGASILRNSGLPKPPPPVKPQSCPPESLF